MEYTTNWIKEAATTPITEMKPSPPTKYDSNGMPLPPDLPDFGGKSR